MMRMMMKKKGEMGRVAGSLAQVDHVIRLN